MNINKKIIEIPNKAVLVKNQYTILDSKLFFNFHTIQNSNMWVKELIQNWYVPGSATATTVSTALTRRRPPGASGSPAPGPGLSGTPGGTLTLHRRQRARLIVSQLCYRLYYSSQNIHFSQLVNIRFYRYFLILYWE